MNFISEVIIEQKLIDLLKESNYTFIPKEESIIMRSSNTGYVLLDEVIKQYLFSNYSKKMTEEKANKIISKLRDLTGSSALISNIEFLKILVQGIRIQDESTNETETYRLIQEKDINRNLFHVTNQFICDSMEDGKKNIPDVVVFINGIPMIVFELKAPEVSETLEGAYNQMVRYQRNIPNLFAFNAFNVISDGTLTLYGTLTSPYGRYMNWRETRKNPHDSLETTIKLLFNKKTLIDTILNYTFHTTESNPKKIMSLPHQYYGVRKLLRSLEKTKDGRGGIFWHTQGSGKSFSMLFAMKNYSQIARKTTFIIVTDRIDLDSQMTNNCTMARDYLNQKIHNVKSIDDLKQSLKNIKQDGIYLTTVQKFQERVGELSNREDIVIITDEAHRSHTNLEGKWEIDEDNLQVERFGNAKYLRDAFPNATFVGFTGTPIETEDKSTSEVFGKVISKYLLLDAQIDKVIVPITYESRRADLHFDEDKLEDLTKRHKELSERMMKKSKIPLEVQKKINKELQKVENFISDPERIKGIVADIIGHYEERKTFVLGKALIVTLTRKIAIMYYKELIRQKPEYKSRIKIIMTNSPKDNQEESSLIGTSDDRKKWAKEFKDPDSEFKIAIVVDMWSTGFDVPCLDTLYLDKPLKRHNLMQTIARINRVFVDKKKGIEKESAVVVDYIGVYKNLKEALRFYSSDLQQKLVFNEVKKLVPTYLKQIEKIYEKYFSDLNISFDILLNDKKERLSLIKKGMNEIIKNNSEQSYIHDTQDVRRIFTQIASKLSSEQKVIFHYLIFIRSQIIKIELNDIDLTTTNKELKNLLDEAIEHNDFTVVNSFRGKKVDIFSLVQSILKTSEDDETKDLTLKLKEKALVKAIHMSRRINKVRAEEMSNKLRQLMKKYEDNFITQEELERDMGILGSEIAEGVEKKGWKSKYTDEEIAFYSIISDKKYTENKLDNDKVKQIFTDLLDILNNQDSVNASWIDYEEQRGVVRAEIKKLLHKHNYPPKGLKIKAAEVVDQIFDQKRGV